ncbi:MAG: response regulator [Bacteroidales bacterium]
MKNIKISTQLIFGFATLFFFVIILGVVSYFQSNKIQSQLETIYNHPLQVRSALGEFRADILTIQSDMKDILLSRDEMKISLNINQIEASKAIAFKQIHILYNQFLGPLAEIDSLNQAFINWNLTCQETARLQSEGKVKEAIDRTADSGLSDSQLKVLNASFDKIDNYAKNKSIVLYKSAEELKNALNWQLILLVVSILLLSLLVNYILLKKIKKPIQELSEATQRFHAGDMSARSSYFLKNEFGLLSDSFNTMVEHIQQNTVLDEKFAHLASLMLSEYDAKKFFQATLNAMATHTVAQMAAIYLLNDDKTSYEHFESFGMDMNARKSFAVAGFDGEFGAVLSSGKIQHLQHIAEDSRFVFNTVSGSFIPREIITIPIHSDNEIIAIISLATINSFDKQSIQLIHKILPTLSARIEGILAFHKMKKISEKLEQQNAELNAQKTELSAQSAELTEQNTELEMQKKQLNEANHLKTNFLSNMSHELRTPLNSVIALSGVLNRRLAQQIPEEEYSYIEVIERNGKHLLELINDILDISRIEAGYEEMEISKFSVNNLISNVVSMIHPQAEQKDIDLFYNNDDSNIIIYSDTQKCHHILQNIIANAVKFTEKGKVEVSVHQDIDTVVFTISDTGIGIDQNHILHIFDEFRQADGSTSRKFGGSGLGLAIAKKYALLLGGNISVNSTLGKGSEFILSLPLRYDEQNSIVEERKSTVSNYSIKPIPNHATTTSIDKCILLVEDSEAAIIQLKDFLEESGYQLLIARNGGEALEIISHTIPDAIILDLMMPGVDGFEVLKTLREAEPTAHIPVLILTAKQITKEDLKFLTRNNIHQLIQKGDVKRNELLNAVSSMVSPKIIEASTPQKDLPTINGKPQVLVVEDNPDNMITVKALLSDNYTVLEAVNGLEGIAMAKENTLHLILMDIALPEVDGIEAFKTIRKDVRLQHIPIVALTASAMTSDREIILSYGFDAYIPKPIDEKVFFKTINEVLYGK